MPILQCPAARPPVPISEPVFLGGLLLVSSGVAAVIFIIYYLLSFGRSKNRGWRDMHGPAPGPDSESIVFSRTDYLY